MRRSPRSLRSLPVRSIVFTPLLPTNIGCQSPMAPPTRPTASDRMAILMVVLRADTLRNNISKVTHSRATRSKATLNNRATLSSMATRSKAIRNSMLMASNRAMAHRRLKGLRHLYVGQFYNDLVWGMLDLKTICKLSSFERRSLTCSSTVHRHPCLLDG